AGRVVVRVCVPLVAVPPLAELSTLPVHDALPISLLVLVPGRDHLLQPRAGQVLPLVVVDAGALDVFQVPERPGLAEGAQPIHRGDRKSTRLNSSHVKISYAVFSLRETHQRWLLPL